MDLAILMLLLGHAQGVEAVRISTYAPGDGHNAGQLACGGVFTNKQLHVAHRRWRQLGCKRRVVVYSAYTGRSAAARVMDAGPFGITDGKGGWRVWTKSYTPPPGWRFRGGVDLSIALWKRLGRPRFLSQAKLFFVDEELWRLVRAINEAFRRGSAAPTAHAPLWRRRRNIPSARDVLQASAHSVKDGNLRRNGVQRTKPYLADTERFREGAQVQLHLLGLPKQVPRSSGAAMRFGVRHGCARHDRDCSMGHNERNHV